MLHKLSQKEAEQREALQRRLGDRTAVPLDRDDIGVPILDWLATFRSATTAEVAAEMLRREWAGLPLLDDDQFGS